MPCNNDETEPTEHGYPCTTSDVAVYDNGSGASMSGDVNRSSSSSSSSINGSAEYENGDSGWTYDRYSGNNSSSSCVSSSMSFSDSNSGGGSADDDDDDGGSGGGSAADDDAQDAAAAKKGKKKKNPAAITNDGYNWIKTLCAILVQDGGERKQERDKRSQKPVKTILRPPTTYQYVIGMSGLSSKVPVYPKWT